MSRGQERTIEGVMALGIVFLVHVVLQVYVPSFLVVNPQLQSIATQALVSLDASSKLGQDIEAGIQSGGTDWGPLANALRSALPTPITFHLTIYQCQPLLNGNATCSIPLPGMPITSGEVQGSIATVVYVDQVYNRDTGLIEVYKLVLTVAA